MCIRDRRERPRSDQTHEVSVVIMPAGGPAGGDGDLADCDVHAVGNKGQQPGRDVTFGEGDCGDPRGWRGLRRRRNEADGRDQDESAGQAYENSCADCTADSSEAPTFCSPRTG